MSPFPTNRVLCLVALLILTALFITQEVPLLEPVYLVFSLFSIAVYLKGDRQ